MNFECVLILMVDSSRFFEESLFLDIRTMTVDDWGNPM